MQQTEQTADTTPRSAAADLHEDPAAEIFVSPRVVDQNAFRSYAQGLRSMIETAAATGRELEQSHATASQASAAVRGVLDELRQRTETGAKLVPTLDQRVAKAEELLRQAEDAAEAKRRVATELAERLDDLVAKGTAAIDRAIETAIGSIGARTAEADTAAKRVGDAAMRAAGMAGEIERAADAAKPYLDAGGSKSITALIERADALGPKLETAAKTAADAKALAEQAEMARAALSEAILQGTERADEVEARKDEIVRALESAAETIAEEGPGIEDRLGAMETRTKSLAGEAAQLAERLDQTQATADAAAESLTRAATLAADLESGPLADLRTTLDLDGIASDVADRAATMIEERLMTRLEKGAKAVIDPWASRVEEMGTWLGTLITRAEQAKRDLDTAASDAKATPAPRKAARRIKRADVPDSE